MAPAASVAIVAAVAQVALLGVLHVLSPELDPAWRVISEYAHGDHGLLLSVSFGAGACAAWALAVAVRSQVLTRPGRWGVAVLLVAGFGQALAAVFDIDHPLHDLAGILGTVGIAVAAVLVGVGLSRTEPWAGSSRVLLWTAQLPWVALVLFVATTALLGVTYTEAGGGAPPDGRSLPLDTVLPAGTIAVNGWFNRLIIVAGAAWIVTVAWLGIAIRSRGLTGAGDENRTRAISLGS